MNPLTLVKRIQSINSKEAALGISDEASWHAKYKDSAYVFVGGIPFDLTEGDLLAVFAQYGEIVDVNLVRDKGTGKSKGFAFIAYEDQRSTTLAVDNLNGATILGRIIRVDHVSNYKKKEEEDEEEAQRKREERGVCRAFQKGECTRGAGCKFSHNEERAANTGGGPEDKSSRWGNDKFEEPELRKRGVCYAFQRGECTRGAGCKFSHIEQRAANTGGGSEDRSSRWGNARFEDGIEGFRRGNKDSSSRATSNGKASESHPKQSDTREEKRSRRHDDIEKPRREEKRSIRLDADEFERSSREDQYKGKEKRSRRYSDDEFEPRSREDYDRREEKRSTRRESEHRDSSSYRHRDRDNHRHKSDR